MLRFLAPFLIFLHTAAVVPCCLFYFSGRQADNPLCPCSVTNPAGVSFVPNCAGPANAAPNFPLNSFAQCTSNMLPGGNAPRTFSARVKCPAGQVGSYSAFLEYGLAGTFNARYSVGQTSDLLRFVGESNDYFTSAVLCNNAWRYVVLSFDGATLRFFLDNALVASTAKNLATVSRNIIFSRMERLPFAWRRRAHCRSPVRHPRVRLGAERRGGGVRGLARHLARRNGAAQLFLQRRVYTAAVHSGLLLPWRVACAHTLPCGHVLYLHRCYILRGMHLLRRGVLQRRGRHLLCVHRVNVPRGHVCQRALLLRRVLPGNRVHRGWAVRAAALLLECEHAGGERGCSVF